MLTYLCTLISSILHVFLHKTTPPNMLLKLRYKLETLMGCIYVF